MATTSSAPTVTAPESAAAPTASGGAGAGAGAGSGSAAASTPNPLRPSFATADLPSPALRIKYRQARELGKSGRHEEAVDAWGALLQEGVAACGELDARLAAVYYQYGIAMLTQVQATSDAFGGAVKKSDGGEMQADQSDRVESMEIAWEVLDVARVLYEKAGTNQDAELRLAHVRSALAELGMENENFDGAYKDFDACLKLRQRWLPTSDRLLADVYNWMGMCRSLQSQGEEKADAKATLLAECASHYSSAADVLRRSLKQELTGVDAPALHAAVGGVASASKGKGKGKGKGKATASSSKTTLAPLWAVVCPSPSSDKEKTIKDLCELVDELEDKVTEAGSEEVQKSVAAAAASSGAGTTTIGFGSSSTAGAAASNPFGGFSGFSADVAKAFAQAAVLQPRRKDATAATNLQVKRKSPSTEDGEPKASQGAGAGAGATAAPTGEAVPKASPPKKARVSET